MKKAFSILLVLALVFMALGCASKPPVDSATNVPPWWNDVTPPEDVLWGDGMAKQSSPSMSMTTAEARARVAIARQLNTLVQAMFVDYNLDAGNVNNQANTSLQENVSRQITNMNVSGARTVQRWQAPDGTYYIRLELSKSDARNMVASILGNQEAAFAEFKAQQALQMLDYQLSNSGTSYRVVD
ncbi:MAG: LPP20 family lipoprotein [Treponema sp.]|nr:LPP20 family lipoprotein [Treponema sp.]